MLSTARAWLPVCRRYLCPVRSTATVLLVRRSPAPGQSAASARRRNILRRPAAAVTSLAMAVAVGLAVVALIASPAAAAGGGSALAATGGGSFTEDRKIAAVVGGLVAVALALTVLTVRYWRQTRPVHQAEATLAEPPEERAESSRSSRRAIAGADHAAADQDWEPRGTGEHERIDVPPTSRIARPGPAGRRAALQQQRDRT